MISLHQTAKAIGILLLATTAVVALATVLVLALDFVLLIFLGVLFSVFLTKTSQLANRYLPIGYGWNLALVTSILLLILIGGFALLGAKIYDRLQATSQKLDEGADELVKLLEEYPLAMGAFQRIPYAQELLLDQQQETAGQAKVTSPNANQRESTSQNTGSDSQSPENDSSKNDASKNDASKNDASKSEASDSGKSGKSSAPSAKILQSAAGKVFSVLNRIASTTLGLIANIGIIFFVGIFIAVDPKLYRDGFARLFPLARRPRVKEVLDQMSDTLFSWLMGRFGTMLITGGGTAAALFVLGVPMAVTVGVITGLLTFVPNIGAVTGLFLAVLLALPQGLSTVGWVVVLYAASQLLESNVITPLLQQHQTSIPPALLIAFQAIMGAIAGFLGLMVATPLLAASLVLIQQVWIKDVLGEQQVES